MAVWNAPKKVEPATEGFTKAQDVATDMMSGAAFDPYKAASREAMARTVAQRRASTANQINAAGLTGQGLGMQAARSTENDLMAQRFENQLNTAVQEQQMRQAGAGLGLNLEQQAALERQNEAQNELSRGQLSLARSAQEQAAAASTKAFERQQLDRARDIENQQKDDDYRKMALDLQRELGLGEQDISRLSLAQQKELAQQQLGLSRDQMGLQRELGLGELDLGRKSLEQQTSLANRNLDLAMRTQSATEAFQNAQIALQQGQLDAATKQAADQLKFQYAQLSSQDKNLLAQINLGQAQLDAADRQFMAQLGLSQQAQNWAEKSQQMNLDLQNRLAGVEEEKVKAQSQATLLAARTPAYELAYNIASRNSEGTGPDWASAAKDRSRNILENTTNTLTDMMRGY